MVTIPYSASSGGAGSGGTLHAFAVINYVKVSPVWLPPVNAALSAAAHTRSSLPPCCAACARTSLPRHSQQTAASHPIRGLLIACCSGARTTRDDETLRISSAGAVADLLVLRGVAAQSGGDAKAPQPVWTPLEAAGTPPAPRKGHAVAGPMFCQGTSD